MHIPRIKTRSISSFYQAGKAFLPVVLSVVLFGLLSACKKDNSAFSFFEYPENDGSCQNALLWSTDAGSACNVIPEEPSLYLVEEKGQNRDLTINHIPTHYVGQVITPHEKTYTVPSQPSQAGEITPLVNTQFDTPTDSPGWLFGITVFGVPLTPFSNQSWENPDNGTQNLAWTVELLRSANETTFDCNTGHVAGQYRYAGAPVDHLRQLETGETHSALIGYAADGFPIYYRYGFEDPNDPNSPIVAMRSGYVLRDGCRPGDGISAPAGAYNGSYAADFEYLEDFGTLDACNGRWGITPEYPDGTYAYFLTDEFPSIPRCFTGFPSSDFRINP